MTEWTVHVEWLHPRPPTEEDLRTWCAALAGLAPSFRRAEEGRLRGSHYGGSHDEPVQIVATVTVSGHQLGGALKTALGAVENATSQTAIGIEARTNGGSVRGGAEPARASEVVAHSDVAPPSDDLGISAREWKMIAKNPEAFDDRSILLHGEVTQFDSGTGMNTFRANVGAARHDSSERYPTYPTNAILTGDERSLADLVEGDFFTATVTVAGEYSYTTTMGGALSVPLLQVDKIQVTGWNDAG